MTKSDLITHIHAEHGDLNRDGNRFNVCLQSRGELMKWRKDELVLAHSRLHCHHSHKRLLENRRVRCIDCGQVIR